MLYIILFVFDWQGVLPDGREIAVKRLFFNTRQWLEQFFNEVRLVSQVQHKNLVKLLGCSVEGPESLLVYEYLCNTSLDHFLFGTCKTKIYIFLDHIEIAKFNVYNFFLQMHLRRIHWIGRGGLR